jgi:hypothetical protein
MEGAPLEDQQGQEGRSQADQTPARLVEDLPTDPSDACSVSSVGSPSGKHTSASVLPGAVCYLNVHGEAQHANRF